jgi:RNA polymerase sigma-70 factor (ECF subfamily)
MGDGADRVPRDVSTPATAEARFEAFVLPEVEVLLRVARSLTRHDADAEDLVQDTLVRAYRAIDRFDGAHPRAWLLTILRNTHINRNRRRRPELLRDPDEATGELRRVASADRTDAAVEDSFSAEVERALVTLDEPFLTVVQLVDIDGLSYAEAAEALGVPVGTVMSRLHRARKRIRDRLDRAGLAPRSH